MNEVFDETMVGMQEVQEGAVSGDLGFEGVIRGELCLEVLDTQMELCYGWASLFGDSSLEDVLHDP